MAVSITTVVKRRRDTEANWIANNPTLENGEQAFSTDVRNFKMGPGAWVDLPYWITGGTSRANIPVTSNPFTYASGITEYVPPIEIYIITSSSDWLRQYSDVHYNPLTGDVTVNVDISADSYVLVVG